VNAGVAKCHPVDFLRIRFELKGNTAQLRKAQGRTEVSSYGLEILQPINVYCVFSVNSEIRQLPSLFQVEAGLTASTWFNLIQLAKSEGVANCGG
jgi:hypothetical protein